jgi:hypothetical protein
VEPTTRSGSPLRVLLVPLPPERPPRALAVPEPLPPPDRPDDPVGCLGGAQVLPPELDPPLLLLVESPPLEPALDVPPELPPELLPPLEEPPPSPPRGTAC